MKIFETGRVYWPVSGQVLPDERVFVCAAATGRSSAVHWKSRPEEAGFFDVKGVAETLLESLGHFPVETIRASHPGFHPGICSDVIVGGVSVGRIGEIHPGVLGRYEIRQNVFLFEIDLTELESLTRAKRTYGKFSRFPYSDRDLAVVVDEHVEAAALISAIIAAGGKLLKHVLLFDIYRGKQVDEGKKSLAFSLRFQSDERTLKDEEITSVFNRIEEELGKLFGAKLRT